MNGQVATINWGSMRLILKVGKQRNPEGTGLTTHPTSLRDQFFLSCSTCSKNLAVHYQDFENRSLTENTPSMRSPTPRARPWPSRARAAARPGGRSSRCASAPRGRSADLEVPALEVGHQLLGVDPREPGRRASVLVEHLQPRPEVCVDGQPLPPQFGVVLQRERAPARRPVRRDAEHEGQASEEDGIHRPSDRTSAVVDASSQGARIRKRSGAAGSRSATWTGGHAHCQTLMPGVRENRIGPRVPSTATRDQDPRAVRIRSRSARTAIVS